MSYVIFFNKSVDLLFFLLNLINLQKTFSLGGNYVFVIESDTKDYYKNIH